jgi:cellulose synthase/poly-beta-1,6-N-acetylglucosamine synthase-like glycosyltransferase
MTIFLYILIGYFFIFFGYFTTLIFLLLNLKKDKPAIEPIDYPFISILVAARNEEDTILSCLESLAALSWPTGKIEILIGNDQSTDNTENIVLDFIKDKNNFRLLAITQNMGNARGKANVLAALAQEAKGDFFFITDADIKVPQKWIQSLLSNYTEDIGIVSGATITEGNELFHYCQRLDWIYAFGMIKVVSDHSIPVSAVGNNMMIARKAYQSTGGYENIPFSVTEDLQLFSETLKKGWKYKNLMSPDCLAVTQPISSFSKLLSQRKRWMRGAIRLPFILLFCLFIQALFLPFIITTLYLFPMIGIYIWIMKIIMQQFFILLSFRKINVKYSIVKGFLLFELYSGFLSILVLAVHLIPTKINWKGRKY